MARIYIGGPGGSGKTVACELVSEDLGISHLAGSKIMMQAAGVSTQEELEALSNDFQDELRLNAFEANYQNTPDMVIDGHFYLTERDIDYFDAFVLVEVDPERLVRFREVDVSRKRSTDISAIKKEISEISERVHDLESKYGIRVIRIKNNASLEDLQRSIEGVYISSASDETRRELLSRGKERL